MRLDELSFGSFGSEMDLLMRASLTCFQAMFLAILFIYFFYLYFISLVIWTGQNSVVKMLILQFFTAKSNPEISEIFW